MKKLFVFLFILTVFLLLNQPTFAGRFCQVHTVYASALIDSGDTYTTALDMGEYTEAIILINITAESGTSTLKDTLQYSANNSTWFNAADAFTNITAIGKQVVKITNFGKYVRMHMNITGTTPDFTGSVTIIGKD